MSTECIFCKIINRELDADIIYEDDIAVAFKDINPAALHLYRASIFRPYGHG
jgi:histidine triad (HIT) family protein